VHFIIIGYPSHQPFLTTDNIESFSSWGQSQTQGGDRRSIYEDDEHYETQDSFQGGADNEEEVTTAQETKEETIRIIKLLTAACYKKKGLRNELIAGSLSSPESPVESSSEPPKPHSGRQTMMRKLEVHMLLMEVLELKPAQGQNDSRTFQEQTLKELQSAVSDFFTAFMLEHPSNKLAVMEGGGLKSIMALVAKGCGVSRVLESVFKDNASLVRDVPLKLVADFAGCIQEHGVHLYNLFFYMDFFKNVLVVKGLPMRRNQVMVLNVFTDSSFSNLLLTYCDGGVGSGTPMATNTRGRADSVTADASDRMEHLAKERKQLLYEFANRDKVRGG
jgi:hypothetical protein